MSTLVCLIKKIIFAHRKKTTCRVSPEIITFVFISWDTAVAQWLRCCAANRKIAASILDGVIGIFH